MFAKKKYARKGRNRKPFRKKARRRTVLRPAPPEPPAPTFDASGASLYSWVHSSMPKNPESLFEPTLISPTQLATSPLHKSSVLSLRGISAGVLAKNADSISGSFLEEALWSCWQLVWNEILERGLDLPFLFHIFFQAFGLHNNFKCHAPLTRHFPRTHASARLIKNAALGAFLAPTLRHHRLENIFSNISIPDFVTFVLALPQASVVVDCSGVHAFSPALLVALCSTRNLEVLDLSNTKIDNQFLYTLRALLVLKHSRLQVLRICDCPNISEAGLRVLMAEPGAPRLAYIESDLHLHSQNFAKAFLYSPQSDLIPGTKWRIVPETDPNLGVVHKFHLANKLLCLLRHVEHVLQPPLIWDFKFFSQVVETAHMDEDLVFDSWMLRLNMATKRTAHVPTMYIKDFDLEPAPEEEVPVMAEPVLVFNRVGLSKPKPGLVKKPRTVKTNANSFFFGP